MASGHGGDGRPPGGEQRSVVRTSCGRTLAVSHLRFHECPPAVGRVALRIGPAGCPEAGGAWLGLAPAEARALARGLLTQAAAVDGRGAPPPGQADVVGAEDGSCTLGVRDHVLSLTCPAPAVHGAARPAAPPAPGVDGGEVAPAELLAATFAAHAAEGAGRFLAGHGLDTAGLRITADSGSGAGGAGPRRAVRLHVAPPSGLPEGLRADLLEAAVRAARAVGSHLRPEVRLER